MDITINDYSTKSIIDKMGFIDVFHLSNGVKQITYCSHSVGSYLVVVSDSQVTIDIAHLAGSQATIRAIVLSSGAPSSLKITCSLSEHNALSDVHIISFCTPHSDIAIDGNIIIESQVAGASGVLLEQNLLLGGRMKLRTLPVLDVKSNDISASHGAKVDRIDPGQLFYCMSRGLDRQQSTQLIIDSLLTSMMDHYESDTNKSLHIPLKTMLVNYILGLMGISGPQIKAPNNRSHRISHL